MSTLFVDTINEKTSGNGIYIPGHVLQVKSATKTDKQSFTSSTAADVTGLSVSITPSSTSSKILVMVNISHSGTVNVYGAAFIKRGSTDIALSTAGSGNQINSTVALSTINQDSSQYKLHEASAIFLDSPATTSATTYKVQVAMTYSTGTVTINSPYRTDNYSYILNGVSTITVMEIGG